MGRDGEAERERSMFTRRRVAKLALGLSAAGGTAAVLHSLEDSDPGTTSETTTESRAAPDDTGNDSQRNSEPATRMDAAGVPMVVPGDLPGVLTDAAPYTLVRCAQEEFEPSETLTVPPHVELDARGATIRPQHDGTTIRFAGGATMRGGAIDLGERRATALEVHAGKDSRVNSPIGPRGVAVRAKPESGAIGLRMAINSGESMIAYQPPWLRCAGVSRPLVMRARGPNRDNNFITSNDIYVEAANFETGVSLIGENTLRKNRVVCNLIPGPATENGTAVLIDNPTAKQNWLEGVVHDPNQLDHVMVVARSDRPGENVLGSWLGRSFASPPEFVDRSKADDNRIVDFSGRPTGRNGLGRSSRLRRSSTVPIVEMIRPSIPADEMIDPDGEFAMAEPGGLQAALNGAAANGPNVVRARNGATFEPNNVRIPPDVTFDARPATFEAAPGNHTLFRFASGSRVIGGHVEASGGYSGNYFAIVADGERIEDGAGPLGTTIEGSSNGDTALLVRARNGGTVENCRAYVHADDAHYGLDMVADRGSRIEDNTFRIKDTQIKIGVRMRGDGVIAGNNGLVQIQPKAGEAETGWLVTNPRARNNWIQGWLWDGQHFERQHVVTIRGGSGNVYPNFLGQDGNSSPRFFKFIDRTNKKSNHPIDLAGIEDGRRAKEPFPADRLIAPLFRFDPLEVDSSDGGAALALDDY
jgi:hypothetical protein